MTLSARPVSAWKESEGMTGSEIVDAARSMSPELRMPSWEMMKDSIVLRTPRVTICFFRSVFACSGAFL